MCWCWVVVLVFVLYWCNCYCGRLWFYVGLDYVLVYGWW